MANTLFSGVWSMGKTWSRVSRRPHATRRIDPCTMSRFCIVESWRCAWLRRLLRVPPLPSMQTRMMCMRGRQRRSHPRSRRISTRNASGGRRRRPATAVHLLMKAVRVTTRRRVPNRESIAASTTSQRNQVIGVATRRHIRSTAAMTRTSESAVNVQHLFHPPGRRRLRQSQSVVHAHHHAPQVVRRHAVTRAAG